MSQLHTETVTFVKHWNETLFSFRTTRASHITFENGQYVTIGLEIDGRVIMRAYSIVSPNYDDELEFFSIKVQNGALTSHLQNIKEGDKILVNSRPTGTLVDGHLLPGKHLYLLSTGTGLAPFLSIIQDPDIYETYEKVILVHGVRFRSELAYQDFICKQLPKNEYFGNELAKKLIYYPSVTREVYHFNDEKRVGRITTLLTSGKLFLDINMPHARPQSDRFMICGNDAMLNDVMQILNQRGFKKADESQQGHYVIEQAFIEQ
uniref:ferredoxin--NADP reductase n=1 Tax=Ningiella ruwaisensis TaxID=2364274 RepID=UPI0010A078AA|nr:ferredoxin--NADP reductase [Ningiella ruwaisensis]